MAADLGVLFPLAALVFALAAAGFVFQRLRLPPAVGYLLVGLFGNALVRDIGLPETAVEVARDVGVLFLLFAIGLELDIQRLREALRRTAIVLPVDILVPALVIAGAARIAGWSLLEAVTLGICLSISSTLFGERLSSPPSFPPEARRRVLGMLLSEDVAAAALLGLLVILGTDVAKTDLVDAFAPVGILILFLVLAAAAALLLVPRLLDGIARTHSHELLVLTGIALVVGFGALGHWAGSAHLGALVAGVAAAEAGSRFVIRNALQTVREVSLAVFFFGSGLPVDAGQLLTHPFLMLALAGLFLLAKVLVHVPTALASGLGIEASLRTAFALGTVGEFSLILVATASGLGIAHPSLHDAVIGAMIVLLLVTPVLMLGVPRMVRLLHRLPARYRKPVQWLVQSARQTRTRTPDSTRLRPAVRLLAVNLVLLTAWILICAAAGPWALGRLPPDWGGFLGPVLLVGTGIAVAAPLVVGTYRAYRSVVWVLVGSGNGEDRASQVRVRLVDAWVAVSVAMLLIPLAFLAPDILPVILGGVFLAIIIVTLAWRRLSAFHQTMEASLARVLGHDPGAGAILDRMLDRYPWGIRFTAVPVPSGSPAAGARLGDLRVRELTGATVAVIQRRGREIVNPGPGEHIYAGDTLILLGDVHQIARGEALVVAHGEALRLTAQSRLAAVVEVEVHEGSALVGKTMANADLRSRTGTLVIGVWPRGAQHPRPYEGHHVLQEGDRLILLGAPLQVERAKLLAEGMELESSVDSASDAPRRSPES